MEKMWDTWIWVRRFGLYDTYRDHIVINPAPVQVIEYIIYHELLDACSRINLEGHRARSLERREKRV
ncbi:MAG: hypothetical protein ABIN18_01030 [Pseudomonadota bacterium]